MLKKSRILQLDPSLIIPYTDKEEPQRTIARMLKEEPREKQSNNEHTLPSLIAPYTLIELPRRTKLRPLTPEPNDTKSRTDKDEPRRLVP
jgi:hypothetical protein